MTHCMHVLKDLILKSLYMTRPSHKYITLRVMTHIINTYIH